MEPKDVINIPTMDAFLKLRDSLNLTDRQRDIFLLKYSRGMRNIDIANELDIPISQDTVGAELKIIRTKLAFISKENMERNNCDERKVEKDY